MKNKWIPGNIMGTVLKGSDQKLCWVPAPKFEILPNLECCTTIAKIRVVDQNQILDKYCTFHF